MPLNASVHITYDPAAEPAASLTPGSATIQGQGTVTWNLSAPPGWKANVTFADEQAPFPPSGEQPEGLYQIASSTTTQPASVGTNGNWPYSVAMVPPGTDRLSDLPPMNGTVVVQNNP